MNKLIKKIIPYLFILIVLVGVFGVANSVDAQTRPPPLGGCTVQVGSSTPTTTYGVTYDTCMRPTGLGTPPGLNGISWFAGPKGTTVLDNCLATGKTLGECTTLLTPPTPTKEPATCGINHILECFLLIPGAIAIGVLKLASLLTYLAGALLNETTIYTVVNMKENLGEATVINEAWGAVRDVCNMAFIFVLLYAAIQTILGIGKETQKLIVKVVIVAILINFSLFFTKFVIDASNIIAITFYDAIAPKSLTGGKGILGKTGIADSLMQPLNLTSIWNTTGLSGSKMLTIGVMGTIVTLIAAFVFFAMALMLIIRFVVLIFVLILSPIAFIASILPQTEQYRKQWVDALTGQAFFAPIYFMLTWIVIKVSRGLIKNTGTMSDALSGSINSANTAVAPNPGSLGTLMNFIIMIVLMIASLIIAKEWANKAGGAVSGMTKWAMGAAGKTTLGGAGWLGRQTIGRGFQAMGESETLKRMREKSGLVGRTFARGAQAAGKKVGSSSLDLRGSGLGEILDAGKAQKGGYEADRKAADKREEEYAKSQEPSDKAKAKAKNRYDDAVRRFGTSSPQALEAKRRRDQLLGNKDEVEKEAKRKEEEKKTKIEEIRNSETLKAAELAERSAQDTVNRLEAEAKAAIGTAEEDRRKAEVEAAKENLKTAQEAAKEIRKINREAIEEVTKMFDARINTIKAGEIESAAEKRKKAHANQVENSYWAKFRGYNYTAAAQIRKGKTNKEKLAEAAANYAKEESGASGETEPTTTPSIPSAGAPTTATPPTP